MCDILGIIFFTAIQDLDQLKLISCIFRYLHNFASSKFNNNLIIRIFCSWSYDIELSVRFACSCQFEAYQTFNCINCIKCSELVFNSYRNQLDLFCTEIFTSFEYNHVVIFVYICLIISVTVYIDCINLVFCVFCIQRSNQFFTCLSVRKCCRIVNCVDIWNHELVQRITCYVFFCRREEFMILTNCQILAVFTAFFFIFTAYKLDRIDRWHVFRTQQWFRVQDGTLVSRESLTSRVCNQVRFTFTFNNPHIYILFGNQFVLRILYTDFRQTKFVSLVISQEVRDEDVETSVTNIRLTGNISLVFCYVFHVVHVLCCNDSKFEAVTTILVYIVDTLVTCRFNSDKRAS